MRGGNKFQRTLATLVSSHLSPEVLPANKEELTALIAPHSIQRMAQLEKVEPYTEFELHHVKCEIRAIINKNTALTPRYISKVLERVTRKKFYAKARLASGDNNLAMTVLNEMIEDRYICKINDKQIAKTFK